MDKPLINIVENQGIFKASLEINKFFDQKNIVQKGEYKFTIISQGLTRLDAIENMLEIILSFSETMKNDLNKFILAYEKY